MNKQQRESNKDRKLKRGRGMRERVKIARPIKTKEEEEEERGGGILPRSVRLIFRQTDKQKSQPADSSYQTDSDSPAAAFFNMLHRSRVPKHFKLGKFKILLP